MIRWKWINFNTGRLKTLGGFAVYMSGFDLKVGLRLYGFMNFEISLSV